VFEEVLLGGYDIEKRQALRRIKRRELGIPIDRRQRLGANRSEECSIRTVLQKLKDSFPVSSFTDD
jgi:hypothetical protein